MTNPFYSPDVENQTDSKTLRLVFKNETDEASDGDIITPGKHAYVRIVTPGKHTYVRIVTPGKHTYVHIVTPGKHAYVRIVTPGKHTYVL